MTSEEKFRVDLEGYLVIKDVLTDDEVAEMNAIIDGSECSGPPSLWGEPFKRPSENFAVSHRTPRTARPSGPRLRYFDE